VFFSVKILFLKSFQTLNPRGLQSYYIIWIKEPLLVSDVIQVTTLLKTTVF